LIKLNNVNIITKLAFVDLPRPAGYIYHLIMMYKRSCLLLGTDGYRYAIPAFVLSGPDTYRDV